MVVGPASLPGVMAGRVGGAVGPTNARAVRGRFTGARRPIRLESGPDRDVVPWPELAREGFVVRDAATPRRCGGCDCRIGGGAVGERGRGTEPGADAVELWVTGSTCPGSG